MKLKPVKNSGLYRIRTHDPHDTDGLIVQSVEHCIGIAEDMASNPVQA